VSVTCPDCSAPGKEFKSGCGCIDYDCGTQVLCGGVFPEPAGNYRSLACHKIQEKGGWNDGTEEPK
jgi:hypothetical protein